MADIIFTVAWPVVVYVAVVGGGANRENVGLQPAGNAINRFAPVFSPQIRIALTVYRDHRVIRFI